MKNKKGFTLVELLAVIVILAIILVIAVPTIMDTIENARKGTLESTAKLIAGTAEKRFLENATLGIEDEIDCEDIAEYNDEDYASCDIRFDEKGKAYVTIVGSGKFEGMQVIDATASSATVIDAIPLKFGRAYSRKHDDGSLMESYVLYEDGSFIFIGEDGVHQNLPRNTLLYNENKIMYDNSEIGTISEDGTKVTINKQIYEQNESDLYYGMPYSGTINGQSNKYSCVFYPDGSAFAVYNSELGEINVTYVDNKIILEENNYLQISDNGKKLIAYEMNEERGQIVLDNKPVQFGVKYIGQYYGENVSFIFSESGILEIYAGDELADSGPVVYVNGGYYIDNSIFTISDDKNYIDFNGTILVAENAPREKIPSGGVYKTGYTYDAENFLWDDSNVVTYTEGDYFPIVPSEGDSYIYGDYEYRYNAVLYEGELWIPISNSKFSDYSGWSATVIDRTKTEYGDMLSLVGTQPVIFSASAYHNCKFLVNAPKLSENLIEMEGTFKNCSSLKNPPEIPIGVTSLMETFYECSSLETAPELSQVENLGTMFWAFYRCSSLKTAPVIPSTVTSLFNTFLGCTNLKGTIEINTSTTDYAGALLNTQITEVTGSTPYKSEILATKNQ